MKNNKKIFYVSIFDRGCGLRKATDEDMLWKMMAKEVGTDNVKEIREATEDDISWVQSMGGYVP